MNLFDTKKFAIKSPITYPGGKHFARGTLSDFFPSGIRSVISPFFGGGSLELYLTKRGISIVGYDSFEPLVQFWQTVLQHSNEVYELVDWYIQNKDKSYFVWLKNDGYYTAENDIQKATFYYLIQSFSYNSLGFRTKTIKNYKLKEGKPVSLTEKSWGALFRHDQLKDFYNPFVSVQCTDFEESLLKHDDMFAYCDPPYPEVKGLYGDSSLYHEDFDHLRLKDILDNRVGGWVLSYNNCPTIRDLYPDDKYRVSCHDWKQASKKKGYGKEVVIRPQ